MTTNEQLFQGVVQFMHPGSEHKIDDSGWTPWNRGQHKRKFMTAEGALIDAAGKKHHSKFRFWGEWEGPSRKVSSLIGDDVLPHSLVEPMFPGYPAITEGLQNTDPYVFGKQFLYTLCKQVKKNGKPTFLTRLAPGTLVLFGSKLGGRFVLDTVFVIDDAISHHSLETWQNEALGMSETYRAMTLAPMYMDKHIRRESNYTLYRGVTQDSSPTGPFSFIPCQADSSQGIGFSRPRLELPGIVNHTLMMGQRRIPMSISEIGAVWSSVVKQILDRDLSLGVFAQEPRLTDVPKSLWPSKL